MPNILQRLLKILRCLYYKSSHLPAPQLQLALLTETHLCEVVSGVTAIPQEAKEIFLCATLYNTSVTEDILHSAIISFNINVNNTYKTTEAKPGYVSESYQRCFIKYMDT